MTNNVEQNIERERATFNHLAEAVKKLQAEQNKVLDEIRGCISRSSYDVEASRNIKQIRRKSDRLVELQAAVSEVVNLRNSELRRVEYVAAERFKGLATGIAKLCKEVSNLQSLITETSKLDDKIVGFYTREEIEEHAGKIYGYYVAANDTSASISDRNENAISYNRSLNQYYSSFITNGHSTSLLEYDIPAFIRILDDDGNAVEWENLAKHYENIEREKDLQKWNSILALLDDDDDISKGDIK